MPNILNTLAGRAQWAADSLASARHYADAGDLVRCHMRAADARRHADTAAEHAVGAAAADAIPDGMAVRCARLVQAAADAADAAATAAAAAERAARPGALVALFRARAGHACELADAAHRRGDGAAERMHRATWDHWCRRAAAAAELEADGAEQ